MFFDGGDYVIDLIWQYHTHSYTAWFVFPSYDMKKEKFDSNDNYNYNDDNNNRDGFSFWWFY